MGCFAVTLVHGPNWDDSRPIRQQQGWDEHAAFMDGLVADGFVVVGGPIGDGHQTMHLVEAPDTHAVTRRLAEDPWASAELLRVGAIEPWSIWLDGRHVRTEGSEGSDALVRGLYEAYQDRDWERAARFLHPAAVVVMPATAERLEGRSTIISFQSAYPEPWGVLTVERSLAGAEGAVAEISVVDPAGQRFGVAAFWQVHEGLLHRGVEYSVTVGGEVPPASRLSSAVTQAARAAGSAGGLP